MPYYFKFLCQFGELFFLRTKSFWLSLKGNAVVTQHTSRKDSQYKRLPLGSKEKLVSPQRNQGGREGEMALAYIPQPETDLFHIKYF